jgi:hemolysin III
MGSRCFDHKPVRLIPASSQSTIIYYGERLNSISHLLGAILALIGLGALLTIGIQSGDLVLLASFCVYGITLVLLFTMSTLYHSFHPPKLKALFKLFDHVAIYILIAGSYTPLMLVSLDSMNGQLILGLVWSLAVLGILSEVFLKGRAIKVIQVLIYLGMGWACTLDLAALKASLPEAGYWWLVLGGVAYTSGVLFYVADKLGRLTHAHGIWHFFVLVGATAHFVAVIGFVR